VAHYPFLAQIGGSYGAEVGQVEAGDPNHNGKHRSAFLDSTANNYRSALIAVAAAKAALAAASAPPPTVFGGSVKDRARAFVNVGASRAADQAAIVDLKARVHKAEGVATRQKAWLERMGARLLPSNHIDWGFSVRTVVYDDSPQLRNTTRIRVKGGKVFLDDACARPLETRQMVTANMGPGYCIYVMSERGEIHVSSHSVGDRHHSSLLAGGNVAGAGEMQVWDGQLKWISNKSGHYFPESEHFLQTLHAFQKKGVALDAVKLSFLFNGGPPKGVPYASVPAFLQDRKAQGFDFELAKLLRVLVRLPYATVEPFARAKGWRWVNDIEYAAGLRAFVTAAGVPVPPRDVRKWLKNEVGLVPKHGAAVPLVKPG
jgi:hypothetical protein